MDTPFEKDMNRRGLLNCMGWLGAGTLYTLSGGIANSITLDQALASPTAKTKLKPFSFLQISDSHIGFKKPANPDPMGTLGEVVTKIKAMTEKPDFILHTGDITHLATPEQFDNAQMALSDIGIPIHFVPGEHDIVDATDPRAYLERFGRGTTGDGWYSFDVNGVHFVGLINVVHLGDSGMGTFGPDQIAWLKKDLAHLSSSTPIVVFSHFPMWALLPDWGWGTVDALEAMRLLKRFGSVTVLNGHIHQIQQKIEGKVLFHTARSTAFPQPAPGNGPGPGPLLLPAAQLRANIGLTSVQVRSGKETLALIDTPLSAL
jgi:hypothetical protein